MSQKITVCPSCGDSYLDAEASDLLTLERAKHSWQPIATAPRGIPLLVWSPRHVGCCVVSEWAPGRMHFVATHWMPLPEGP